MRNVTNNRNTRSVFGFRQDRVVVAGMVVRGLKPAHSKHARLLRYALPSLGSSSLESSTATATRWLAAAWDAIASQITPPAMCQPVMAHARATGLQPRG